MKQDLEKQELYEKRIRVACNLLGITVDFVNELTEEMYSDVTSGVIRLADKKNPNIGLCKSYQFTLSINRKCRRECTATHIVDGIFDVLLCEDTKSPDSKYCWDRKILDMSLMPEDELLKMMDELHYTAE